VTDPELVRLSWDDFAPADLFEHLGPDDDERDALDDET